MERMEEEDGGGWRRMAGDRGGWRGIEEDGGVWRGVEEGSVLKSQGFLTVTILMTKLQTKIIVMKISIDIRHGTKTPVLNEER